MALTVEAVVRYTVHGTCGARPWANVIDINMVEAVGQNRSDQIYALAGELINGWAENIVPTVAQSVSFDKVTWVDLQTDEGETGSRSSTDDHTLPMNGGSANTACPPNTAILVQKLTSGGRATRDGRMYIVGVPENHTPDNGATIDSSYQATVQTAVDALMTRTTKPGTANYASSWRVVHTPKGHTPSATVVNSLNVEGRLATQRRRLRK